MDMSQVLPPGPVLIIALYGHVTGPSPGDNYGTTHGSYVLPIYDHRGDVSHLAGVSYSTKQGPPRPATPARPPGPPGQHPHGECKEMTSTAILFLCLSVVLGTALCYHAMTAMSMRGGSMEEGEPGDRENTQTLMKNCYTRAPEPEDVVV